MSQAAPAYVSRIRKQLRAAEAASDASLLANLELMRSIITSRQTEDAPTPYIAKEVLLVPGEEDKPESFILPDDAASAQAA